MKKLFTAIIGIAIFSISCNKSRIDNNMSTTKQFNPKLILKQVQGVEIPEYASFDAFRAEYSSLEQSLLNSMRSTYENYPNGFTEDEMNSNLPFEVLEDALNPLYNFSISRNFHSLFSEAQNEKIEWLKNGNSNFEEFPSNKYAIDNILMSMINNRGDMIIGDKILHYVNEVIQENGIKRAEVGVLVVPISDSILFFEFENDPTKNNLTSMKVTSFPPTWAPYFNDQYTGGTDCQINVANWGNVEYSNRRKYYWKNIFFHDIIKSTVGTMMEAYYKVPGTGNWIPNVLSMKVGIQTRDYNNVCAMPDDYYVEQTLWCSINQRQAHKWGAQRGVKKLEVNNLHQTNGNHYSAIWHYLNW